VNVEVVVVVLVVLLTCGDAKGVIHQLMVVWA